MSKQQDLVAELVAKLGKTEVRDKLLRTLQFAAKIDKFSTPEHKKVLAGTAAALSDARKTLKFWKWIEVITIFRSLKGDSPLHYALLSAKAGFLMAFIALDNVLWCANRGLIKMADVGRFKRNTYTLWGLGLVFGILSNLVGLVGLNKAAMHNENQRMALAQKRRQGENVEQQMSAVFNTARAIQSKSLTLLASIFKDVVDLPIALEIVRGGGVFNGNLIGLLGMTSSLTALGLVWDK